MIRGEHTHGTVLAVGGRRHIDVRFLDEHLGLLLCKRIGKRRKNTGDGKLQRGEE